MAQRTIASFFPRRGALADATNVDAARGAADRAAFPPPDAKRARRRPFETAADVVAVPNARRVDADAVASVVICRDAGRDYLVSGDGSWDCDDVTRPAARAWHRDRDAALPGSSSSSGGPIAAIRGVLDEGRSDVVVRAFGSVLDFHRPAAIDAPPLASFCLRCCVAFAEANFACACATTRDLTLPADEEDHRDVVRVAAAAAPQPRAHRPDGSEPDGKPADPPVATPNLAVCTRGSALHLLGVVAAPRPDCPSDDCPSDRPSDCSSETKTALRVASLSSASLTEGAFRFAFPSPSTGGHRLGPIALAPIEDAARDAGERAKERGTVTAPEASSGARPRFSPVRVAIASGATGALCFLRVDALGGAALERTVEPHLPGALEASASIRDVAVWSTAAGGAAAVTVGGDGVLAATRFDAALGSARDSAWPCVGGGGEAAGAACVAVAVCDRAGLAVTLAEDQAEVRVWDLATERLVRAARFERGGAREGGGGGGRGGRRARALAAIGGTNGRVVGVYRERGREEDGTVVQIVRGR